MIHFNQAEFINAAHYPDQWPEDSGIEVAFAGRSNVGKSSAINTITNINGLAKTSKTPGRTQQIVFFEIDETRRLVDLPGYGFAKAPEAMRKHWQTYLEAYLVERQCLKGLVLPMDIRRPFTDLDNTMLDFCWHEEIPVHILLTKADKLKFGAAKNAFLKVQKQIQDQPQTTVQLFSALKKQGVEEARKQLNEFYNHSE